MKRTAQDILNFVEDNDVKFAKLYVLRLFSATRKTFRFLPVSCPAPLPRVSASTGRPSPGS